MQWEESSLGNFPQFLPNGQTDAFVKAKTSGTKGPYTL